VRFGFRIGVLVPVVWLSIIGTLLAGEESPTPRTDGVNASALLVESYRAGKDLVPSERAILLSFLGRTASQHHLSYTTEWAQEALRIASQLPPDWNRLAIQKNALVVLSYADPDHAMALLRSLDLPVEDGNGVFPEDVRSDAARTIFKNYWIQRKLSGLDEVRSTAAYLGQTGQYPYMAVGFILNDVISHQKTANSEIPGAAWSILFDAYASYQRGSKFRTEDEEFVNFLESLRTLLPPARLKSGVEIAVERLTLQKEPAEYQYISRVQTQKGTASFHNQADALLLDLLPLVREVDAALADKLLENNQALKQVGAAGSTVLASEGAIVTGSSVSPEEQEHALQTARAQEVREIASNQPEQALALSKTIADPALRSTAMADVAESRPTQAGEIQSAIAKIVPTIHTGEERLVVLSALAKASWAAGDIEGFHDALGKSFALGEELFEEDMDARPGQATYVVESYGTLVDLVKTGARVAPTTITAMVRQVDDVQLKAFLLAQLGDVLYSSDPEVAKPSGTDGKQDEQGVRPSLSQR
jgi:hypothetical protein